jgi:hypothetical protein
MPPLGALLLACSLHFDDPLLVAVAEAFSAGSPFVVVNVAPSLSQDDHAVEATTIDRAAADRELARVLRLGGEPVVGILPLRLEWLTDFGKTQSSAFDPCVAIEVASAKLSEFDYLCRARGARAEAPARRACTLERYGASLALPGLRPWVLASLTAAAPTTLPQTHEPAATAEPSLLHQPGGIFYPSESP